MDWTSDRFYISLLLKNACKKSVIFFVLLTVFLKLWYANLTSVTQVERWEYKIYQISFNNIDNASLYQK